MSAIAVETWHRFDIRQLDDLRNAVLGIDLEAIQMPGVCVRGSLAFAARDGIVFSSGQIRGDVLIRGVFSDNTVTLGVVLETGAGSRLWLNKVTNTQVAVIPPGQESDFLCRDRVLYVAATLTPAQLKAEAARIGLAYPCDLTSLGGLHPVTLEADNVTFLKKQVAMVHGAKDGHQFKKQQIGGALLRAFICHYAQHPVLSRRSTLYPVGKAQIVRDACNYIEKNLARSISIDAISEAAFTSRRSLFRAFSEFLGDTPKDYVLRLRLHRIRRDLISKTNTTVSGAAHNWGIAHDMGRLSRNYKNLFGEMPGSTLALGRELQQNDTRI